MYLFLLFPGTDATHAEHIETIKNRRYVGEQDDGSLVPGELGMGLVEGKYIADNEFAPVVHVSPGKRSSTMDLMILNILFVVVLVIKSITHVSYQEHLYRSTLIMN